MAVPYPESSRFWVLTLVKRLNHTRDGIPAIHAQRLFQQLMESLLWHLASWTEQSLVLLKDISCFYSLDHSQVWFWVLKPCCYFLIWWWLAKLNRFNSFPSCQFIQVFSAYPILNSDIFLWLESKESQKSQLPKSWADSSLVCKTYDLTGADSSERSIETFSATTTPPQAGFFLCSKFLSVLQGMPADAVKE